MLWILIREPPVVPAYVKDQTLRTVFVGMGRVKRRLGSVMRIKIAILYTNVKTNVVHVQVIFMPLGEDATYLNF